MVVRGGSSSDSRLPSTNALTCHSKSFPIRRAYPKTCPFFQICHRPTFLKPSARRVRRRYSTEPGEIDSTIHHELRRCGLYSSSTSTSGSPCSIMRYGCYILDSTDPKTCSGKHTDRRLCSRSRRPRLVTSRGSDSDVE